MDELEKAKARITDLETSLETEKAGRKADLDNAAKDKEALAATIATKDVVIAQKTDDIVKLRQNNTRLKEASDEEKASMTKKELEQYEILKASQDRTDALEKQIADGKATDLGIRRKAILDKYIDAAKNPEARAKLEEKLKGFLDFDKLETPEDIEAKVKEGFTLVKADIPTLDPVRSAHAAGGGEAPNENEKGFADTEQGKSLATNLNLSIAQPEANGGAK